MVFEMIPQYNAILWPHHCAIVPEDAKLSMLKSIYMYIYILCHYRVPHPGGLHL